jgi:hypothetical protein
VAVAAKGRGARGRGRGRGLVRGGPGGITVELPVKDGPEELIIVQARGGGNTRVFLTHLGKVPGNSPFIHARDVPFGCKSGHEGGVCAVC